MAQIIGMQNAGQTNSEEAQPNSQQPTMGGGQGVPTGTQELGPTGSGGGNIGTGDVPIPGEDSFSGTLRATGPTS